MQKMLLEEINRMLHESSQWETEEELGKACLNTARQLTHSDCGFFGIINSEGCLMHVAVSHPGWENAFRTAAGGVHENLLKKIKNQGNYKQVVDSRDLPDGHFPLEAFLGTPLVETGEITGMIGLGRKKACYGSQDLEVMKFFAGIVVHILMRKRAEKERDKALQLAGTRTEELNAVTQSFPVGIIICDHEGNLLFANDFFKNLSAAVPGLADYHLPGPQKYEISSMEGKKLAVEELPLCRSLSGETVRDEALVFRGRTGKPVIISASAKPICSGSGRITGAVATYKDITRYKLDEKNLKQNQYELQKLVLERTQELRDLNEKLVQTIESITDAFFTLDTQGRITYWNRAAEKIYGLRREEVLGMDFWQAFPKLVGTEFHHRYLSALCENKPVKFEARTNTGLWLETRAYPSGNGLTVYLNDISQRKLAEEKLRQSEEFLYRVFHSSPAMMCIQRLEDNFVIDVNESWIKALGFSRSEVIGFRLSELDSHFNPPPQEIIRLIKTYGRLNNYETGARSKNGDSLILLTSAEIIQLYGEKAILWCHTDITRQKRMEKEMARLDRLYLVGEMAAGLGHEIRNPMTTVKGFLQLFTEKKELFKYKETLTLMIEELDRANQIITEFLILAKNKRNNPVRQNLNKIIEGLYPLIMAEATKNDQNIVLKLRDLPDLLIDGKEIRQVIHNLVRNGLEAMDFKGCLSISTFLEGDRAVLAVKDQGPGIRPEIMEKIGTPFFTTKDSGTGLGLSVCYSIAARHGAKIDIDTGRDGTTVNVKFKLD